ncbi:MAG: hypothetical protein ACRD4I_14380, partial [Candidatus Angelobacter sp.]
LYVFSRDEVQKYWEELEPFIMRSVAISAGTLNMQGMFAALCNGDYTAMATLRNDTFTSVLIVEIVEYAEYGALRIVAISGKDLYSALDWLPDVEEFGSRLGAIEFEAWCRPAMVRLLRRWGWSPKLTQMVKPFRKSLQ